MTSRTRLIVGVAVVVVLAGVVGGVLWARRARSEGPVAAAAAASLDPGGASASGRAGSGSGSTPGPAVPSTAAPTTAVSSTADPAGAPLAAGPTPSGTAVDGGVCTLDLTWPTAVPGWIEPLDPTFTCAEMAAQWQRNEQWPGERGGTLMLVDFGDGWYCTGVHWDPNLPPSNVVGSCDLGGRRFNVYQGAPGIRTPGPAAPAGPGGTDTSAIPTAAAADLLITPSGNIRCARHDGRFACTIQEYDFDLGDERCPAARGPIVRLDATGPSQESSCQGDFFDGIAWPDPTPYGTTVALGDVRCDVESTGVSCTNADGHGFTLSRAGLQPF